MATFPDYDAGERITAAKLNARNWHEVTEGTDRTGITTVVNSNIVIPRVSGETYWIQLWARWSNTVGGASNGVLFNWSGDGTVTRNYIGIGSDATGGFSTQSTVQIGRVAHPGTIQIQAPNSAAYTHFEDLRTTGTDNLIFQVTRWGTGGTVTLAGSTYCRYLRIG